MGLFSWLTGGNKEQKQKVEIPTMDSCAITVKEVKEKLDRGEPIILVDVREDEELALAKIEGALHIPMGEMHSRYKEISDDPNAEVIVFCHHGHRSEQVMTQLWGLSFQNAKTMEGGIHAWSEEIDSGVPTY